MPVRCREIINIIERLAPTAWAAEWDNVGLMLGDPDKEVKRVLVSLDVSSEVVEEAIARGVNLIISHHPLFFHPFKTLRWDEVQGNLVKRLIQEDIMVYSAHTNLDHAVLGVSYHLAARLQLKDVQVLAPSPKQKYFKLVTFVPEEAEARVREAVCEAGAGWIGNYSHCTFRTQGTGTFLPLAGAKPYIGEEGRLEETKEYRLETIVPQERLSQVLNALLKAHPYEEVAYDIYPLANEAQVLGLGRVGVLPESITLQELALKVKKDLGAEKVAVVGDREKKVRRVAVCGGAGADLIDEALKKGAEVLITGDIKYHEARKALEEGLALIDAGHFATEKVIVHALVEYLQEELKNREVMILSAQKEREPWWVL